MIHLPESHQPGGLFYKCGLIEFMPSFGTSLKALFQLGIEPLALNTLYKLELRTGYYRKTKFKPRFSKPELSNIESTNIAALFHLPSRQQLIQTLGVDGQAALVKEADEIADGKVIEEARSGYMIFDTVLRPAQVIVGKSANV